MESLKILTDDTINLKYNNELGGRERPNYSSMIRRDKYFCKGLKYKRIWKMKRHATYIVRNWSQKRKSNADCMHLNA